MTVSDDTVDDAPARAQERSVARWRRPVATAALGLMVLMITKGPVYWIRYEAASISVDPIDDRWIQATFLAASVAVALLAAPGRHVLARDRAVVVAVAAFVGLVAASTAWSVTETRTLEQAVMLAAGTAAVLLAGAWLDRFHVLVALWCAMQAGVLASAWADLRDWDRSLDRNGDLAGIYFNRNSLGPVAVVGAAAGVALVVELLRRRRTAPGAPIAATLVALTIGADLLVWQRSGSLTPVFGSIVATAAVGLLVLSLPGPRQRLRRRIALVAGVSIAVLALVAIAARDVITDRLDRSPTFSGRTTIWDVVLDFVGDRPLQGYGFMAVWRQPEIIAALDARGREVYEAHSGYLEVLLGVGVIGLIALLVVIGLALHRTATAAMLRPGVLGVWSFALVAYAVGVNVGETFVGANLLPWALLALGTAQAIAVRTESGAERVSDHLEASPDRHDTAADPHVESSVELGEPAESGGGASPETGTPSTTVEDRSDQPVAAGDPDGAEVSIDG